MNTKRKLDLNGLLSKYQGISNTQTAGYYSPAKGYEYGQNATVSQDFYQSRQINNPPQQIVTYTHSTQPVICNFQMSKSQCQTFLLKLKEQLRNQQRQMQNIVQTTHKRIHQRFQSNHERIKRQILELLEKAFRDNQRQITQELKRQGNVQPQQFVSVHKQIAAIDDQINSLLYGLKGAQYRQSIANTILKNFEFELTKVNQSILAARENYENSLGEVQPDRQRIQCLREDLQRLFRLSKKNTGLVNAAFFSVVGGGGDTKQPVSYSQPPPQSQQQGDASNRQRKSFFNFMGS